MSGSMLPKKMFEAITGLTFKGLYKKYYLPTFKTNLFIKNIM